jgi:hypothetical protein
MLNASDSFAYSGLAGFPAQKLDWTIGGHQFRELKLTPSPAEVSLHYDELHSCDGAFGLGFRESRLRMSRASGTGSSRARGGRGSATAREARSRLSIDSPRLVSHSHRRADAAAEAPLPGVRRLLPLPRWDVSRAVPASGSRARATPGSATDAAAAVSARDRRLRPPVARARGRGLPVVPQWPLSEVVTCGIRSRATREA